MFLKEERDSLVKARMYADKRKQKDYIFFEAGDYIADGGDGIGVHHRRCQRARGA